MPEIPGGEELIADLFILLHADSDQTLGRTRFGRIQKFPALFNLLTEQRKTALQLVFGQSDHEVTSYTLTLKDCALAIIASLAESVRVIETLSSRFGQAWRVMCLITQYLPLCSAVNQVLSGWYL